MVCARRKLELKKKAGIRKMTSRLWVVTVVIVIKGK